MSVTTTWADQIGADLEVDIRPVPEGRRAMIPGRSMLYPSARMLNDAIREIPTGETITVRELRERLAVEYGAEYTCPVTTTRSMRVVAEAANEARRNGAPLPEITPVWRAMEKSASALRQLTFDPAWIVAEREREQQAG
jgi:hypothetical protein